MNERLPNLIDTVESSRSTKGRRGRKANTWHQKSPPWMKFPGRVLRLRWERESTWTGEDNLKIDKCIGKIFKWRKERGGISRRNTFTRRASRALGRRGINLIPRWATTERNSLNCSRSHSRNSVSRSQNQLHQLSIKCWSWNVLTLSLRSLRVRSLRTDQTSPRLSSTTIASRWRTAPTSTKAWVSTLLLTLGAFLRSILQDKH